MNFALPTIILLLMLVPGFLFRRLYYSGEFSKEYFKQNFTDYLFPSLIFSILIHLFCQGFIRLLGYKISLWPLFLLVGSNGSSNETSNAFLQIYQNIYHLFFYFTFTAFTGAVLGQLSKYFVRKLKLDRKYQLFRYQNEWHYVFTGEILDFPNISGQADVQPEVQYVDALVKTAEGSVLYSGYLSHYVLSSSNGIDQLYLSDVKRRYLKANQQPENTNPYYYMPGDFTIIPYREVMNLNITYYRINQRAPEDLAE